jgi:hypothetical protein
MKTFIAFLSLLLCVSVWGQSVPELPALGGAPATGDLIPIVDVSAGSPPGVDKSMTIANLITLTDTLYQSKDADLTSWAGVTRASGIDTFVATPSGANLASALTSALPASKGGTGLTALSANVVTMFGAADFAAIRALLGLDTGDSPTFAGLTLTTATVTTVEATNLELGGTALTVSGAELNALDGIPGTLTATEIGYADGLTSAAQTQLDAKAAKAIVTKHTSTNYTVGTTDANELYGGVIYVGGACTITIPAVAAGASFTVITIGAVAVSVDPNASDLIVLDGTALSDGDKVTNTSTTGDIAVFTYYDGTGWYCTSNNWTDGN